MIEKELSLRADPDALLAALAKKRKRNRGGKLILFIGMAPGVGKTYAMLQAAKEAKKSGVDVVVGVVETHGRKETEALLHDLEIIPKKELEYRDRIFPEMDIDAILDRKPSVVLVDELAHANIPGSRHNKRWQDVVELLDQGIDVYSTLNVQHLESRKDAVEEITRVSVLETVPDSMLDRAYQIQLIDLSVPNLLQRLKEGKVYLGEKAELAAANFFKEEKLTALREIALRLVAERVDAELKTFATEREAGIVWPAAERLMVAVDFSPESERIIRAARRMAYNLDAPWFAVHITTSRVVSDQEKAMLAKNLELARNLGAEVVMAPDSSVVDGLIRLSRQKDITQLIVGRSKKNLLKSFVGRGSLVDQLMEKSAIDVCIIGPKPKGSQKLLARLGIFKIGSSLKSYVKALFFMAALVFFNTLVVKFIGFRSVGFLFLLGILVMGLFLPIGPVMLAAIATMFFWNIFFIPPVGIFHINQPEYVFLSLSYLVAALATGILTRRNQYQHEILINREARSEALRLILLDVSLETSTKSLLLSVIKRVENFLRGNADVALLKKDKASPLFVEHRLTLSNINREMAVAKWVVDNNKAAGRFTETLASADAIYIPIRGLFDIMGVLAFQPIRTRTMLVEDVDFLYVVARQLALALELESFRKRALESEKLSESEKMHQTLLKNLVSEMKNNWSPSEGKRQIFIMDNALLISRLTVGIFPLKKEICDVNELIEMAKEKINFAAGIEKIRIHKDENTLRVSAEKDVFIQAIANVLLSALEIAKDAREIDVQLSPGEIIVRLKGINVVDEDLGRMFDKFYRSQSAANEKFGGELFVAKGIIKAHEGKIVAKNQEAGGFLLSITYPLVDTHVNNLRIKNERV